MERENGSNVIIYSYDNEQKAVAYIDVIGFSSLAKGKMESSQTLSKQALVSTLLINCVERYREAMLEEFPRDVPCDETASGYRYGHWYKHVGKGAVNFVLISDCIVLYSNSIKHLFRELSAIYGAAIVFGVPIRTGVVLGGIWHSEWVARPGTNIPLYGDGYTRAVKTEKQSKKGMRVFLEEDVAELIKGDKDLSVFLSSLHKVGPQLTELKWWLSAFNEHHPRGEKESSQLRFHYDRWYTGGKDVGRWFARSAKEDTDNVVNAAVKELKKLRK